MQLGQPSITTMSSGTPDTALVLQLALYLYLLAQGNSKPRKSQKKRLPGSDLCPRPRPKTPLVPSPRARQAIPRRAETVEDPAKLPPPQTRAPGQDCQPKLSLPSPKRGDRDQHGTSAIRQSTSARCLSLLENVASWENLQRSCARERKNGGSPGMDGMTVEELPGYLNRNAGVLRNQLLDGSFQPQPVRKVTVEKFDHSGARTLAIPTVLDRLVQRSIQQVIGPIFDPQFSPSSFAFRPNRNAHHALDRACGFVAEGFNWVVHIDLKDFFDSIDHDLLLKCLAKRVREPRLLDLVRRFISAPFIHHGVTENRQKGIPQGGPLSPFLANLFLHSFDKELESQSQLFCRFADDISLYVDSEETAEAVLDWLRHYLRRQLRLEINVSKSGIGRPWTLPFLGYLITQENAALKTAPASWRQLKDKVREVLAQNRHAEMDTLLREHLNPVLRGWRQYFRLGITPEEDTEFRRWLLDHLRRRLWHDWDQPKRRARHLIERGIPAPLAWEAAETGYHNRAATASMSMEDAFPEGYFSEQGLIIPNEPETRNQIGGVSVPPPMIYGRFFD